MDGSCDTLPPFKSSRDDYSDGNDRQCVAKDVDIEQSAGEAVPDCSREESRHDDTTGDHDIDSIVKSDGFLRIHDSEDEVIDDEDDIGDHRPDKRSTNDTNDNRDKDNNTGADQKLHQTADQHNVNVKTADDKEEVSANSAGDLVSKDVRVIKKSKPYVLSNKWGETVGIADESGRAKRIVNLSELKNYVPLRMRFSSQFKYYFSLIDQRYPQLFRTYASGGQRWRMRYNIFVDGLFDPFKKFDSILHIGEIMIYFDIGKELSIPYYVNSSFYGNYTPLERSVDTSRLTRMIVRLHDILSSSLMLQLKFPVDEKAFKHTDAMFYRFLSRQKEMMNELRHLNNRDKPYYPMKNRFTIEGLKRGFTEPIRDDYQRRPIDNRRRDYIIRPTQKRVDDKADRLGADTKSYRYDNNRDKRNEQRIGGRRYPDTRAPFRRLDDSRPLREKTSNLDQTDVGDRNSSKKSFQKRNSSVDKTDTTDVARNANELRPSDRNPELRSRPKTRRR